MKLKALLIIAGFTPAIVIAQAKPANELTIEKPIPNTQAKPSATPKQTQAGEFPALHPSPTPHVISVGGTTATEFQQKTAAPSSIEKPVAANTPAKLSEDAETPPVIFSVDNWQRNIHGYHPITKPQDKKE
jgi:hypothetical protein